MVTRKKPEFSKENISEKYSDLLPAILQFEAQKRPTFEKICEILQGKDTLSSLELEPREGNSVSPELLPHLVPSSLYDDKEEDVFAEILPFHLERKKGPKDWAVTIIYRQENKAYKQIKLNNAGIQLLQSNFKLFSKLTLLPDHKIFCPEKIFFSGLDYAYLQRPYFDYNLTEFISERSPSFLELRDLFFQVFFQLDWLHEKKITHGNVKPENILISKDLQIILVDYQESKNKQAAKYSAPEAEVTPKSDVYSVGVIMLEKLLNPTTLELPPVYCKEIKSACNFCSDYHSPSKYLFSKDL